MNVNKVIIFGNSGSGKSTLAKKLQVQNQLAHLDLDTVAWQATQPPRRKPLGSSQKIIESFMAENNQWVIEGCYVDLLQIAAKQAEQAVFMDLPISLCQDNARNRPWEPHKYANKQAQDANLDMLLEWIAAYSKRTDAFSYQAHLSLYNHFTKTKYQISDNQS